MGLRNVTLELSLKPFGDQSEAHAREVCRHLFTQWLPLLQLSEVVSVMMWLADGSEILDYRGDLDDTFEWAYLIGGANVRSASAADPNKIGLHQRSYEYMEKPPAYTYRQLKRLVSIIKEVGRQVTGKPIRVGETFDPGPEFAKSPFKYERHNELCAAGTMGGGSFMCCYTTMHADDTAYAGYPDGVPEGTPIGSFLGRQSQCFLSDLGFDYLWLSNGFGFGLETWALRGAVFDGKTFSADRCEEVREKILAFWESFRAECPDFPLETRGTNLSTGMDLSSDAVPLRDIYRGGYQMQPPPNSPWAAINGDFGLELVGWMSKIAEIPEDTYPFRFYTHDPWWANSPWLDRYERIPHDIYLPMAVSRLDAEGVPHQPTSIEFLTADDSWGRIPDIVPREVNAHLIDAYETGPDAPGPVVWVYPFDEYHDLVYGKPSAIEEVFFGDWYLRGAVNAGFPLNTVITTANFVSALKAHPERFTGSVLLSPVPTGGTAWEAALLQFVKDGGKVLIYGPLARASEELKSLLGVTLAEPLDGQFELSVQMRSDEVHPSLTNSTLLHPALLSAGGMEAVAGAGAKVLATAKQGEAERVAVAIDQTGRLAWVRGTVACDPERVGGHLLVPYPPEKSYPGERLLGLALAELGVELYFEKHRPDNIGALRASTPAPRWPMTCISRHLNGFQFAGYRPLTTVATHLRLPQGAPLLYGYDAEMVDGRAVYYLPRASRLECRVFIEQESGEVGCRLRPHSEVIDINRRVLVNGLQDATVRFYPEPGSFDTVRFQPNPRPPFILDERVPAERKSDRFGEYLELRGMTGDLLITWFVNEGWDPPVVGE